MTLAPGCEPRRYESSPAVGQKGETLASPNHVNVQRPTRQVKDTYEPAATRSYPDTLRQWGSNSNGGSRLSPQSFFSL